MKGINRGLSMKAVKDNVVLMLTYEQADELAMTFFKENGFIYTDDDTVDMVDEFIAENGIIIID